MAADPRPAAVPFDAYAVLDLDPTASADDVRRAYRRLARVLHPDANPGDVAAAARFRRVAEAYALLGDPIGRARYDVVHGHARGVSRGPRPVRQGPAPSGNTTVRGPTARPAHRPREAPAPVTRPEVDEWSFLGRFARWAAVVAVAILFGMLVMLLVTPRVEPVERVPTFTRPVPGGQGFCEVPEGWVACALVESRGP